jgi:hypothetical protein
MPSPLQTASARRKVVYLGLILGLFVVNTFFWRGAAVTATDKPPWWTVQAQANRLELTEAAQGQADLLGSTVRLVLTGSRGLAVTILWNAAIEKQMKHEWNELEFLVRSLTKLQPHFLTPWLFQSWNLSYNVSVESDRVKDKYFYISRGVDLLAQGERLNKDNPDMRYWIGFYYQNKFGVSDEANTLRSLFQLSCIKPEDRDPKLLAPKDPKSGRRVVDLARFEAFCKDHPQLVKRLREPPKELNRPFRCATPDEVIEFLEQSQRLPGRFVDPTLDAGLLAGKAGDLKPADQQFPNLPTVHPNYDPNDFEALATDTEKVLDDKFDAYAAARSWFAYAQDPLPDPVPMVESLDRKERLKLLEGKKLPRQPAEVLFRQTPPRAQSYVGERLHKEGWYDDSGWTVDAGRSGLGRWFPDGRDVVVGAGQDLATQAWQRAYNMWREYGIRNGLMYADPARRTSEDSLAKRFRDKYQIGPNDMAAGFNPDKMDPEMRASLLAHRRLFFEWQNRQMTNFPHFMTKANAEKERETGQARKAIDRAEEFRRAAEPERAIEAFEDGFKRWLAVFRAHDDFRNDDLTQEEVYEAELHYLDLIRDHRGEQLRPVVTYFQSMAMAATASAGGVASPAPAVAGLAFGRTADARPLAIPFRGPLDQPDDQGVPWIKPDVATTVRQRLNVEEAAATPRQPPGGQTPPRRPGA